MQTIFALIEKVAATTSKNEKLTLLQAEAGNDCLRIALDYAYNPFKTYGIAEIPSYVTGGCKSFDAATLGLLDALIARQLTGSAARTALQDQLTDLHPNEAELLRRIIIKDLRAGFSVSTINKVFPKLIPEFAYKRCGLVKDARFGDWPWAGGVPSQEKADGMFSNIDYEGDSVIRITSRQGMPFNLDVFPAVFLDSVKCHLKPGTQTHGEFLVFKNGELLERSESNGVMSSLESGSELPVGHTLRYLAWDQIPISCAVPKGRHEVPYRQRLKAIEEQLAGSPHIQVIPTEWVRSFAEAQAHYRKLVALKKEGTVLKHPEAPWYDTGSQGSADQIKFKLEATVSLRIVGKTPGEGKNAKTFGALVCRTSCDQLEVNVSGMKDAVRKAINDDFENHLDTIIDVKANAITFPKDGGAVLHSLAHPRFVDKRTDVTTADDLTKVIAQFEAAANGG